MPHAVDLHALHTTAARESESARLTARLYGTSTGHPNTDSLVHNRRSAAEASCYT